MTLLSNVFSGAFSVRVQFLGDRIVLIPQNLNAVFFCLVLFLRALHFLLGGPVLLFERVLFIVKLIFQSQKVFVKRDTISEQRFIT